MNILSFALAILAVIIFAGAFQGHKYGSLGGGLAVLTLSWTIQIIWQTSHIIRIN